MPTIAAASQHIVAEGQPVLLLDTCILLDLVRAPQRRNVDAIEQAVTLLSRATGLPPRCLVVAASIVPHEWQTNRQQVVRDLDRHLATVEEHSRLFHEACTALGITLSFGRGAYTATGLAVQLDALAQQLLDASVQLAADQDCKARAMDRVTTNLPPARKGGQAGDCLILEEYLELARQVRAGGGSRKLVFCTSNINDYCTAGGLPHPNLAVDFAGVQLLFTTNLRWAVHELCTA